MMNKENLQLMSTMLGEVIDGTWSGTPVAHKINFGPVKLFPERVESFNLESWVDQTECGYSACAVGHACYDRRFQALGLAFNPAMDVPVLITKSMAIEGYMTKQSTRWDAVSELFGISVETGKTLFLDDYYSGYVRYGVSPKRVKARVEELLLIGEDALKAKYPPIDPESELSRERPETNDE